MNDGQEHRYSDQWPLKCEAEETAVIEKRQNEANLLVALVSAIL